MQVIASENPSGSWTHIACVCRRRISHTEGDIVLGRQNEPVEYTTWPHLRCTPSVFWRFASQSVSRIQKGAHLTGVLTQ